MNWQLWACNRTRFLTLLRIALGSSGWHSELLCTVKCSMTIELRRSISVSHLLYYPFVALRSLGLYGV